MSQTRSDEDDLPGAARAKVGNCLSRTVIRPQQVRLQNLLPGSRVALLYRAQSAVDACIDHQDIETAELLDYGLERMGDGPQVPHVGLEGQRAAPVRLDLRGRRFDLAARAGNASYRGPGPSVADCDRPADSSACSRDRSDSILERGRQCTLFDVASDARPCTQLRGQRVT